MPKPPRTNPPQAIGIALDHVLAAMDSRGGFTMPPGAKLEVAWVQARQVYQVLVEFRLDDDPVPPPSGPGLLRVGYTKR